MNNHSLAISMMRNSSSHTNSSVLAINTTFVPHTETKSTEKLLNGEMTHKNKILMFTSRNGMENEKL